MLPFLVASKARRRLLTLLWAEGAKGTATRLGERARVSFASAYRELRQMDRWGLVVTQMSADGLVYAARLDHPDADLMERLVRSKPLRVLDERARDVRAHLAEQGAPLRADAPTTPAPPFEELVVEGVELAARDAEVARSLPVFLYKHRAAAAALASDPAVKPVAHRLGFFLALAGHLAGDATLERAARPLRDRRVKRQSLFQSATFPGARKNFPLARAWGLRAGTDLEWFEGLFEKFAAGDCA